MKKAFAVMFLCSLFGCGGSDPAVENCRWVRFIPEQGDSYYEYICDPWTDNVRYIPEAPSKLER
jgi:hypothetical protein